MTELQMYALMKCVVRKLEYNFATRTGDIYFPTMHCCDMASCIKYFLKIDMDVEKIVTHSGKSVDTIYTKYFDGWSASLKGSVLSQGVLV